MLSLSLLPFAWVVSPLCASLANPNDAIFLLEMKHVSPNAHCDRFGSSSALTFGSFYPSVFSNTGKVEVDVATKGVAFSFS